jgi:TRAP-type C4-dicarboxylate transport system substrate-binding protein
VYQYKLWAASVEESYREIKKAGVTILYPELKGFREATEVMYSEMKISQPELFEIVDKIRKVE